MCRKNDTWLRIDSHTRLHPRVVGGRVDDVVEGQVEAHRLLRRHRAGRVLHRLEDPVHLRQVVVGEPGDRALGGHPLDGRAQRVDLLDVLLGEDADERTAVPADLHLPLGLEDRERLAHRSPADAQRGGDLGLAQVLPGLQLAARRPLPQDADDVVGQRRAGGRRPDRHHAASPCPGPTGVVVMSRPPPAAAPPASPSWPGGRTARSASRLRALRAPQYSQIADR